MPRRKILPSEAPSAAKTAEDRLCGSSPLPALCARIRLFRERAGLEQKELAARLGVTAGAVSNWETGRGRPDLNLLPALCRELGISFYELFGQSAPQPSVPRAQQQFLERFLLLTPAHRTAVEGLTEALLAAQDVPEPPRIRKLLFFDRPLAAGIGDPTEWEGTASPLFVYAGRETERADCVFTVSGDSMEPAYCHGDRVLVSRIPDAAPLQPGEVGAFLAGNETYIKVLGRGVLESLNPAYPPLRFDEEAGIRLIGRVVGILDPAQIIG